MVKNQDHPFFRPLWRRVAIVVVTAVWALVEAIHGDPTWSLLTLGICLYAVWTFFITYPAPPAPGTAAGEANASDEETK